MRQWIRRIAELINVKSAWNFAGQPRRHILIIFRVAPPHVGARQPDFGAESTNVRNLFLRHLVRYNENYAVTFRRRHQGESQSRVTCLTEHGKEIGDDYDDVVDSGATHLERFQGAGGNIDLRVTSGKRTDGRGLETELLCQFRCNRGC